MVLYAAVMKLWKQNYAEEKFWNIFSVLASMCSTIVFSIRMPMKMKYTCSH